MNGKQTSLNRLIICVSCLFVLVAALASTASATDYYVATWGDNSSAGTSVGTAWQNVSYATQQVVAGDTIYLIDGTWYNEHAIFANSGNATHPITLTAYNGTPTLDGVDKTGVGVRFDYNDHIKVSHLTIRRYDHTIDMPGSYIHVSDCDLSDTGGVVIVISQYNSTHNTIENCTLHDSGWNTIQMSANRELPNGNGIPATYITVRNCTIYNSIVHNAIDLYGNLQYVTIEENEFYANPAGCIYEHDYPDHREYVTIRDNYFHDTQSSAINIGADSHYEIYNNTFENITGSYPMYIYVNSHDFEIYNNSFYNCLSPRTSGGYNLVFERNYIHTDSGVPIFSYGSNGTVRNPIGKKSLQVKFSYSVGDLEFDDGTVFTATFGSPSAYTPVRYYPDKSNCSITSTEFGTQTLTPTTYSITLRPTYAYLTASAITETSITISSTRQNNPTTITNTLPEFASKQVTLLVDGSPYQTKTADRAGFVSFDYTGSWSTSHTFSWQSGGPAPTGSVTGRVTDTDNYLITDAEVTTGAKSTLTNSDGEYTITGIAEGYYTLTASKDGYQDLSKNIHVTADETATLDFQLSDEQKDDPPVARVGSDQTVYVNTPVIFDGSASTDDHGITSYVWDFDASDGIHPGAAGAIVSHTYTEPGAYIAALTVTDTSGQTDSDFVLITVLEQTIQKTDVSKITQPIVPDGSLSEWAGADTVIFAGSDNTATVSLTWDEDNLYFGFDITDTNLQASGTDEADPLHLDDSIEIYLDTEHDGGTAMQVDDYHFIINLNHALVDDQGTGSGKNYSWTSQINYAIDLDGTLNNDSDTDNGYVIEVAIPWSDIREVPAISGVMGLDLCVNDRDDPADGRKPFDWCNITLASWAVPDGWGDATFRDNNRAPLLNQIGDKSINEGSLLEFTISASDPDGDPLTYSADNLPSGATSNPETRTFSWTPDYGQAGSYPDVHFEVTDGSLTDTENITITVNSSATIEYIRLEAEDADEINPSMEIASDPLAYNGSYIWVPDGGGWKGPGYARYNITITAPGDYKICGRVQAPTIANNSFLVRMDDNPDRTWTIPVTDSWAWDDVNHWGSGTETDPEIDPVIFTLSAGEHVLTIKHRECGTKLDKLLITNDLTFVPHAPDTTPPVADAGQDQTVDKGSVAYFDGSGSTDNVGIRSYSWDFDASDGIQQDSTDVTASYMYTESSSYIVTLTVTDTSNNTDTDTCMVTVDVASNPVTSHFGVNDTSGISGTYTLVPVKIANMTNGPIQTIKFDILYDENVLNLNSKDPKSLHAGTLTDAGWLFMLGSNNHSITLATVWQSLAIPDGSTGSVILLNFSVIGAPGATSYMDVSEIEFANTENELGTAPAENGTFSVLRLGTISGTIAFSCNETAIAGAVVTLTRNGSLVGSTITDANGMYIFTDLELGEYDVSVTKIHFWDNSTSVTTYMDQETVSDLVLLLRGDLNDNGEIADAADVNMMMQAFTRDIPGNKYFDLNENDKIADFGDVEMILRASIGELIL